MHIEHKTELKVSLAYLLPGRSGPEARTEEKRTEKNIRSFRTKGNMKGSPS